MTLRDATRATLALGALFTLPAHAMSGIVGLNDDAGLLFGAPAFTYCDTSAGAAPGDGKIHYDSATASGACGLGGPFPGFSVTFDVEYGAGAPAGLSGVSGALYYIKFTNLTLFNATPNSLGPGDNGFTFAAGSPANFPDGVVKTLGVIMEGSVDDNDGNGAVAMNFHVGGGIDYGGAATFLDLAVSGPTAPGASIAFAESLLGTTTFGIQGSQLVALLNFNAAGGNGFTLPSSFELIALGENYTWNPVVVPLPAAGWLLGTALGITGVLRRRLRLTTAS